VQIVPVQLQISRGPVQVPQDFEERRWAARADAAKFYNRRTGDFDELKLFRNGKVVGFVGVAGVGKTTSVKKWVQLILDGKVVSMENPTFLFFIRIRDINFDRKVTVLEFLTRPILPNWKHSAAEAEENEQWLKTLYDDENTVIALDGLDEAGVENLEQKVEKITLFDEIDPVTILLNLLTGKLLPKAKIIITSRPDRFYRVLPEYRPKNLFEIVGLDETGQNLLGHQICDDDWQGRVKDIIFSNPDLFAYCYVPVTFILTADYLMKHSQADIYDVCLTKVLASALNDFWASDHWREYARDPQFDKLAFLAWEGHKNMKIIFSKDDIKRVGIDEETCHSFLMTSILSSQNIKMKIFDGKRRLYFSHLIWQEFFAAVHLILFATEEEFQNNIQYFFDDRWEVVVRCFFGLCSKPTFDLIKCFSSQDGAVVQTCWERKKAMALDKVRVSDAERETTTVMQDTHEEAYTDEEESSFFSETDDCADVNMTNCGDNVDDVWIVDDEVVESSRCDCKCWNILKSCTCYRRSSGYNDPSYHYVHADDEHRDRNDGADSEDDDKVDEEVKRKRILKWNKVCRVCSWMQEANVPDVSCSLFKLLPDPMKMTGSVLPVHITNFFYAVQTATRKPSVKIIDCVFTADSLRRFCDEAVSSHITVWFAQN